MVRPTQRSVPLTYPDVAVPKLLQALLGEPVLQAILGHARYSGVPRESLMAKTLFAVDELTGLITATALVRPSKSLNDMDVRSVQKKMKDKAFARGCNREDIVEGAAELGVELPEHIQFVLDAMRARADMLGLGGMSAAPA